MNKKAFKIFNQVSNEKMAEFQLLTDRYIFLETKKKKLKMKLARITEKSDMLEQRINKRMLQYKMKSFKRDDGVLLSLASKKQYFINPDKKLKFFKALKSFNLHSYIKRDVNYHSLQGLIKGLEEMFDNPKLGSAAKKQHKALIAYLDFKERPGISLRGLNIGGE